MVLSSPGKEPSLGRPFQKEGGFGGWWAKVMLTPKHFRLLGYMCADSSLATFCRHGMMCGGGVGESVGSHQVWDMSEESFG